MPAGLKEQILGALTSGGEGASSGSGAGSVCQASPANGAACDFSRIVLASTEDVLTPLFERGALPAYGSSPGAYQHPTLVMFANSVSTDGCGTATSAVGPFYCPADRKLRTLNRGETDHPDGGRQRLRRRALSQAPSTAQDGVEV
jgi:predicted metalloprotease